MNKLEVWGKKMEIPKLEEEEIQQLAAQHWTGFLLGTIGFIMQKLGPEGAKEFNVNGAKNSANALKAMGMDNPKSFAMNDATRWKNVYGSDISVKEDGDSAIIEHKKCACLTVTLELAKKGMPISKAQHCAGCISYYKSLLENLGMKLEPTLTDVGCVFRISK